MTNPAITAADLEQNGIIFAVAETCVQALQEAAATATAERFIHLASHQVADAGELTAERVAQHLQETLKALKATTLELYLANCAGHA